MNWTEVENEMVAWLNQVDVLDWERGFTPLMAGVMEDQATLWALLLGITFETRNVEAEAWFQDYVADFARNCTLRTEEAVKGLVSQALAEGWSVPTMQTHLLDVFEQWQAGGMTSDEFDWMLDRMPAHRTEMIARTETIRASNKGNERQFASWGVEGKEWLTAKDDRLCAWCEKMDGTVINVTEPFFVQGEVFEVEVGQGEDERMARLALNYEDVTGPPLHPNCRCTLLPWKQEWAEFGLEAPALVEEWLQAADGRPLPAEPVEIPGEER